MGLEQSKTPLVIVTSIVALGIGVAAGGGAMMLQGYQLGYGSAALSEDEALARIGKSLPTSQPKKEGRGKFGKGGKGGGKGGRKGKPKASGEGTDPGEDTTINVGRDPAATLKSLVAKVDILTHTPLKIDLTPEQRKQVAQQAREIDKLEPIGDNDAKKHLDALRDILRDHLKTLREAGFKESPSDSASPSQAGAPAEGNFEEHLKSLAELSPQNSGGDGKQGKSAKDDKEGK